jgi:hypothetical protein
MIMTNGYKQLAFSFLQSLFIHPVEKRDPDEITWIPVFTGMTNGSRLKKDNSPSILQLKDEPSLQRRASPLPPEIATLSLVPSRLL